MIKPITQTFLNVFFLIFSFAGMTADDFDQHRPDNVGDKKWSSLKAAVQEAKLLPEPAGIGGGNSQFGQSVSVDGDRALVGGPNMAGTGVVYVLDYDGVNWQESAILQPTDGESGDNFGYSLSLSGDRALVGARYNDDNGSNSGSAYVYDYNGASWSQIVKLTASDGASDDWFGYSVSLSGNRALVGAHYDDDNGNQSGSAYVYDFNGSSWNQTAKLLASDGASDDWFGYSVSLSGNRALVGAMLDDDNGGNSGSAYIYDYNGTNWNETAKLIASDGAWNDWFGISVSLSGNRALVGARYNDDNGNNSGSAYVYDYNGASWSQTVKLNATDGAADDWFGTSVSLSGDHALVGAHYDDDNGNQSGSAYVYDFNGSSWNQTAKLLASDGASDDWFGYSVSLSGNRALVGAMLDDDNGGNSGSAYVYDYNGTNWNETAKLIAADGAAGDYFGFSVSLSGDRALVGAPNDDDNGSQSGSAYVFDYNGIYWSQTTKLTASDGAANDNFGRSVSLSGNRALVGADGDDDNGSDSGSAYVYDYNGSNWSESSKLTASDGAANDNFGRSVSLSNNRALVGANGDDDKGSGSGSAYVFDYNGTNWNESAKLTAATGASHDSFGVSVSLNGNRALVGAFGYNNYTGSAYVFDYNGTNWSETTKLIASDSAANNRFGNSVSLSGNRVLVGADGDDDYGSYTGSAYVYDYNGTNWNETAKLTAADGAAGDHFGQSVSLSGNHALVGAFGDGDNGSDSGSAYVYDYNGTNWSEKVKLTAADGLANDWFGLSVSLSGDSALVGTPYDDDHGTNSGSAYVINLAPQYNVNINVIGLAGNSVSFSNGADTLTITANGTQTISTLDDGSAFDVDITAQPSSPNQTCNFTNADSGNLMGADYTVNVSCVTTQYNVNITVTGLAATNSISFTNGTDTATFTTNTTQTISTLDDGSAFNVSISSAQPDTPDQVCGFTNNNSGNLAGGNYEVTVECITTQYSVGGTVSGLATGNEVILQNNGTDDLMVSANGSFVFGTNLDDETAYAVTVLTQPTSPNQTCTVTGGDNNDGTGNLSGGNETGIIVTCTTNQYSVGGSVSGLASGNDVVLQNNGGDDLTDLADGSFVFDTQLDDESSYAVTVLTNPTTPNQTCSVSGGTNGDGTGVLAGNDDTSIVVTCETNQYSVGGNVSGLASGNDVVLQNNAGDDLTVSADGVFTFATLLDDESTYEVTVLTQPTTPNQQCTVTQGTGTLTGADVTDVQVNCVTDVHSIGGTVTGLANNNFVTLSMNAGDEYLVVNSNSAFTFLNPLADGSMYEVTVLSNPTTPNQSCTITNGSGNLQGADITDIEVECTINQYIIGGYVNGLIPDNYMVLQNNLIDDLMITNQGAFAFPTPLDDQQSYDVTIQTQPNDPIQSCELINESGSLTGSDIENVFVVCEFGDDLIYRHGFDTPEAISRALWEPEE